MKIKLFFTLSLTLASILLHPTPISAYARQANAGFDVDSNHTPAEIFKQCRQKGLCLGPKDSLSLIFGNAKVEEGTIDAHQPVTQLSKNGNMIHIHESRDPIFIEDHNGKLRGAPQTATPREIIHQAQCENPGKKYVLIMHSGQFHYEDAAAGQKFTNFRPSPHTDPNSPIHLVEIK